MTSRLTAILSILGLFLACVSGPPIEPDFTPPMFAYVVELTLSLTDSTQSPGFYQSYPSQVSVNHRFQLFLKDSSDVRSEFFDVNGNKLRVLPDTLLSVPGNYAMILMSADTLAVTIANGVYFCRVSTVDTSFTSKFIIIR